MVKDSTVLSLYLQLSMYDILWVLFVRLADSSSPTLYRPSAATVEPAWIGVAPVYRTSTVPSYAPTVSTPSGPGRTFARDAADHWLARTMRAQLYSLSLLKSGVCHKWPTPREESVERRHAKLDQSSARAR